MNSTRNWPAVVLPGWLLHSAMMARRLGKMDAAFLKKTGIPCGSILRCSNMMLTSMLLPAKNVCGPSVSSVLANGISRAATRIIVSKITPVNATLWKGQELNQFLHAKIRWLWGGAVL